MKNRATEESESSFAIYRRLLSYVLPYWPRMLLAMAAMTITALTEPAFAALIKPMIDGSFVDRDPFIVKLVPVALLGVFLIRGIFSFVGDYTMTWIGRTMVLNIRNEAFAKLLRLPTRFFDHQSSGALLSKLTYDVERIQRAATQSVTTLIRDTLTVIGLVGYMFYLSGWLALIFLLVGPVMAAIVSYVGRRFRNISRRIQRSVGEVATVAEEGVDGHLVIKTFGAHDYEMARFERINQRNARSNMKFSAVKAASTPVTQFVAAVALSVIIYLATLDTVVETLTPGTFMSFIAAMLLLMPPLKRLTEVVSQLQTGIAAGESLFALIDEPPEADTGKQPLTRAEGHIQFRGIEFNYPGAEQSVLKGIDLEVKPGQTVALVGRSGSGKTTLVSLLPRFYDLERGEILLDGHPLQDYRLEDLRRQIAWVGQQVVLFNDTVAANIAYGCLADVSREAIVEAAKAAYAHDFIERLPQGYDTPIGENGVMLSGGQRQRLAIARALLKDAPILVLDEATSALDTESERQIQAALDRLMLGRTTLVIAHRLSTIENADKIVVLDQGKIVESGRHDELLAKDGHYAALHRLQFREQDDAVDGSLAE